MAAGAGLALDDERVVAVGFIVVHLLSTALFVASLAAPAFLGLTGPYLSDSIVSISIVIAFRSQFPFVVLLSLFGCVAGFLIGGKFNVSG